MSVTAENKIVAKYIWAALGAVPKVTPYHHDTLPLTIDIFKFDDRPFDGVISYATIGLSDYGLAKDNRTDFSGRVELVGACSNESEFFPNVIAGAAFRIIRTRRIVVPGEVMPNYVKEYFPNASVPHLYFTTPFLWKNSLKTLDVGTKSVSWLLAMPVSSDEFSYLRTNGHIALEDLFEQEQINLFDLNRPSVI